MRKLLLTLSAAGIVAMSMTGCALLSSQNTIDEFTAKNGKLTEGKGDLCWVLEAKKTQAFAINKPDPAMRGQIAFYFKMKSALKNGVRNGFLYIRGKCGKEVHAGVFIGNKTYAIAGAAKKPVSLKDAKMDQNQEFKLKVTVDLDKKIIALYDKKTKKKLLETKFADSIMYVNEVGYTVIGTTTRFSDITAKPWRKCKCKCTKKK